ncbi:YIP1 family protein [Paenibacillus sp.]|uniref:YIP1 family protein n=1 Tax=Paenibacillus sp. TaxID=58172 RepID=UPI00281131F2|nr:YIP1 family protein [Paenibacillus sp.]
MVWKTWKTRILAGAAVCLLLGAGAGSASAMVPYKTYTYDYEGNYVVSPDAYVPDRVVGAIDMGIGDGTGLNQPQDLVTGPDGRVYIADTGHHRIVVLDEQYRFQREIRSFARADGTEDGFNAPAGLFVTDDGTLYVADSKNARIVALRPDGSLLNVFEAPDADVLPAGFIYEPSAVGVDQAGRMYVISKSTNMGVIALNADGRFDGFVGAEKVEPKALDLFWELVTTDAQRSRSAKNVPTEYNNIAIDELGFAYVTSSALDARNQLQAMRNRDRSSQYAPIKRLNNTGIDVLKRNGAYPPAGDLQTAETVSRFIDAALTADGVYSALDATQNKLFTYDGEGNLLYAFGGTGSQNGVFRAAVAIAYQGEKLLALDANTARVTVFARTAYGDAIAEAIRHRKERNYDASIAAWREVLKMHPSFELAYSGVAMSHMRKAEYREAMENYKLANDWDQYFKAFAAYRKEVARNIILLIPIAAAALVWLAARFFAYARKVNAAGWKKAGKRTYKEELLYALHLIVHPFDGFWDLKHERRGSFRAAVTIVALVMAVDVWRTMVGGYVLFPTDWRVIELHDTALRVLIPFVLWVCANWGLTTLMDGEGSLKDIFIASAYALTPIVLIQVPAALFSNVLTLQEVQFVNVLSTIAYAWAFALIFVGVMVTNDYAPFKNFYTSAVSVVGMGFVAFLVVLFINILQKMQTFFATIVDEITFRL